MSHTPTIVDHARVTIMTFYLPSIPASLQTLGRCECVATRALAPLGLRIISPLTFYLSFLGAIWTYDKKFGSDLSLPFIHRHTPDLLRP